jgi:hypothetical protein
VLRETSYPEVIDHLVRDWVDHGLGVTPAVRHIYSPRKALDDSAEVSRAIGRVNVDGVRTGGMPARPTGIIRSACPFAKCCAAPVRALRTKVERADDEPRIPDAKTAHSTTPDLMIGRRR